MQLQDQLLHTLTDKILKGSNEQVEYELPSATSTRLGGIIVSDGLSINSIGELSESNTDPGTVVFSQDGNTITETTSIGTKTTVFNQDGTITETYPSGKIIQTSFNSNGDITKTLITQQDEEGGE